MPIGILAGREPALYYGGTGGDEQLTSIHKTSDGGKARQVQAGGREGPVKLCRKRASHRSDEQLNRAPESCSVENPLKLRRENSCRVGKVAHHHHHQP